MISALHSVLGNIASFGRAIARKPPRSRRLLPILAVLGNMALAVSVFAQDSPPCLSGQGPLQEKQWRCVDALFVQDAPLYWMNLPTSYENYTGIRFEVIGTDGHDWRDSSREAVAACKASATCRVAEIWAGEKLLAEIDADGNYHAYAPPEDIAAAIMAAVGSHQ